MRGSPPLAALVLLLALPASDEPPAYHPAQLDCAHYHQSVRSTIDLEGAGTRSRERAGREGLLALRATAADSALQLVAWFDTLSIWREGSGERLAPGTDGIIGGRYRGRLSRLGGFTSTDRPFVPDDVAEVDDLGEVLTDLLPPLPAMALAAGSSWKDDFGAVFTRLPDGVIGGVRVERFRLIRRRRNQETRTLSDSTEVVAEREESEVGSYAWSGERGPIRWEREVTLDVTVPVRGIVRQSFRTHIVQQIVTERVGGSCEG